MEANTISLKKTARLAGLLYLIWVLTGLYGIFYVSSQTIVPGDTVATANKILANEFLFRTSIINDIISNTIWVFIALLLYRLLKQVNERQAKLLVALVIVQIPAIFFMEALNITSLMIFKGEILKTFEPGQRQDLAMLFLKINDYGSMVLETFWGLWLLPFGQLVYRSGFIPRILGIFLILDGLALILHSFISLLLPDYQTIVRQFATPFWILGEISIMLWLLIIGVKFKEDTIEAEVQK
jgi:Domain of unknown function (DUF4386)